MKEQVIRYNDDELALLKQTFAEDDTLLKIIRKVMLQMPLNESEIDLKKKIIEGKKDLIDVLSKSFLPVLDGDSPINQQVDLLMTLQIAEKTPEEALPHINARKLVIIYLEQQLKALNEFCDTTLSFEGLAGEADDEIITYENLTARNTIILHVEQTLMQIKLLAGLKSETPTQTLERLAKNSSK